MDARSPEDTTLGTHATTDAVAITAIVLVAVNLRPGIVSVGPLLPSIIDEFGLSHAAASLLVAFPTFSWALWHFPHRGSRGGSDGTASF